MNADLRDPGRQSSASLVVTTFSVWAGLALMILSEAATLARAEPFASWNTPICWTGFIIFADAIVYRARGESWMRSSPREFALLAVASIPLWLVFEFYNLYLDNWYYTGLPENLALRTFGYAWSFATIWPAIFEGSDLVAIVRPGGQAKRFSPALSAFPVFSALSIALGAVMLASPLLTPPATARYLAGPVWLGFIFLLDPINRRLGAETLTRDRAIHLGLSGLLCGVLWEFWNFWSASKWHYTVPIMAHTKIFEMPLPGYLGFPAFALECFTMYVFVRRLVTRGGRSIA